MEAGELVYEIRMDREAPITLSRDKVLHVPGLGFDGFMGYSVVAMARKSIGLGMAMETFGATFFGNGTNPGMVVSHPGKLSGQGGSNLKDALTAAHSGLGKSHRLLLLEEGMKVEKYGIPPNDCQFLESRQFQIPEVARWFNLPPHKLKDLTKSSFSNIEQEQISFVTDSILPWLVRLEANFNMQLLTLSDKELSGRGKLYFKHSMEGLLRGDSVSRAAFYSALFGIGVLSPNDICGLENWDPHEGGDEYFVPLNMVPLSMVKEQFKKKLEALQVAPNPKTSPDQMPDKGKGAQDGQSQ
jgi:HK97 family phage portal protein